MDFTGVIERIRPKNEESKLVESRIKDIVSGLQKHLKDAKVKVGGSFAKGTWLSGMHDVDIFVCFSYSKFKDRSSALSDILESALKKSGFKYSRLHGSRDYFTIKDKLNFEIVPILEIKKSGEAKNITDVSMLHVGWVRKNIGSKRADEVRLFKAFCIGCKCYGAESYISGLSGYVCEILVAYYGSFLKAVRGISLIKGKKVLDISRHYKPGQAELMINASKLQSPIVIVDSVQKERNAAAGIGIQTFQRLQKSAIFFLKKPAEGYFVEKHFTPSDLRKEFKASSVVQFTPIQGKRDVVFSKLVKVSDFLVQSLEKKGFKVSSHGFEWSEAPLFWINVKVKSLQSEIIISGPPSIDRQNSQRFKKAHRKVFVKAGRLYAKEKREFTEPESFLKSIIRHPYVKERSEGVKLV